MSTKLTQVAIAALAGAGLTAVVLTMNPLQAHPPDGSPRWGPGRVGGPGPGAGWCHRGSGGAFDVTNVETLEGTATHFNRYGGRQGMFLTLQTDAETVDVHVGPYWYLERQGFEITLDEPIEVTGFRNGANAGGQTRLMASEIKQGDRVLQLRDANGYPLWMGRGAPAR